MDAEQPNAFLGYVKVAVRSRSPKLWGWDVHREGSETIVQRSTSLFSYAEDAWKSGQLALACFEAEAPLRSAKLRLAA